MKYKNIIYVNFAQYDNTGRILDFLRENFSYVVHFSYDHLRLKNGRPTSYLRIYQKNKLVEETKLIRLRVPGPLLFPSLPLVAFFMFLQTIWYSWRAKQKYHEFEYFLTLNAYSAWIGNILRTLRIVKKTIFWVGDYFPIDYPDWRIRFARWVYWKFDKPSMHNSDKLIFTNERLMALYKKMKLLPKSNNFDVIPIGTTLPRVTIKHKNKIIGFLGMIKSSQGLDLVLQALPALVKKYPDMRVEIIGSGPEEDTYRRMTYPYKRFVTFYGFIEDQNEIQRLIKRWSIGLATYKPEKSNESYWGDPSKIKAYISVGVPVITTDVSYMSRIIKDEHAGKLVVYETKSFIRAVTSVLEHNKNYQKHAFSLARKYYYKDLYPRLFKFYDE